MTRWIPSRDDREPFVFPDGRTVYIKYTFVQSEKRPQEEAYGHFRPRAGIVQWATGAEDTCIPFGLGDACLERLREESAILPSGPERDKTYEEYIQARKYILDEMIGRVVSVGGGETPNNIWVLGVEETSSTEFEIMLSSNSGT